MRLFIGYDIPASVKERILPIRKDIGDDCARIKWVEPENLHLTLKFLGEVDEKNMQLIRGALRQVGFRHFVSSASGFGVFPSESYARVLWVGLSPHEKIAELHEAIDSALGRLGFPKDDRFQPHITLGRIGAVTQREIFVSRIRSIKSLTIGEPFRMDRFALKKSTLTPAGPVYEDVEIFPAKA
jgi:2'-5' RNA ligase